MTCHFVRFKNGSVLHLLLFCDSIEVCSSFLPFFRLGRMSLQWKSISINPIRTEYLLAASDDPLIRVYDRRMLSVSYAMKLVPPSSLPCETYLPLQVSLSPRRVTSEFINMERLHPTHVAWVINARKMNSFLDEERPMNWLSQLEDSPHLIYEVTHVHLRDPHVYVPSSRSVMMTS